MGVLLSALKIIGIILLGMLALALVIFLLILLVPLKYDAEGEYYDKGKASASIHWLLNAVRFEYSFDGNVPVQRLYILGHKVGENDEA